MSEEKKLSRGLVKEKNDSPCLCFVGEGYLVCGVETHFTLHAEHLQGLHSRLVFAICQVGQEG